MVQLIDLPDELIIEIMSHLALSDRKTMRLVCRFFLDLSFEPSLIKKDVVVVDDCSILPDIKTMGRISNLWIKIDDFSYNYTDTFCSRYGPDLISIHLMAEREPFCYKALIDLFKYCPKVQDFTLSRLHPSISICIPSQNQDPIEYPPPVFKALNLHLEFPLNIIASVNSTILMRSMLSNMSSMRMLHLIKPHGIDNTEIVGYFRELSFLKELTLDGFDSSIVLEVCKIIGTQLTELQLQDIFNLSGDILLDISETVTNLKVLTLNDTNRPTVYSRNDYNPLIIFERLSALTHVKFEKTEFLTDDLLRSMINLQLECLELSGSFEVTDGGIIGLLGCKLWPSIKELRLKSLSNITNSSISIIMPNLPNIRFLEILNCTKLDFVFCLRPIVDSCKNLEYLSIYSPLGLEMYLPLFNKLQNLVYLALGSSENAGYVRDLQLLKLKTLELSGELSVRYLSINFHDCPSLQHIIGQSIQRVEGNGILTGHYYIDRLLKKQHIYMKSVKSRPWGKLPSFYKTSNFLPYDFTAHRVQDGLPRQNFASEYYNKYYSDDSDSSDSWHFDCWHGGYDY